MLEPDQWNSALNSITGTLIRGTERVSTAHCLDLLEVGPDPVLRQRVAKRMPRGLGPGPDFPELFRGARLWPCAGGNGRRRRERQTAEASSASW